MAELQILLVGVEQAEVLLGYLLVNFGSEDEFVEHLEQLEAGGEGGVVVEALADDGGHPLVDVLHGVVEVVVVALEAFLVLKVGVDHVHDVLLDRGELLHGLTEEFQDILDILGELVSLGAPDVDVAQHALVDVGLDHLLKLLASDDEVVQVEEESCVYDVPEALALLPLLLVDGLEVLAGVSNLHDLLHHLSRVALVELADEVAAVELAPALGDDLVADEPDECHQVGVALVVHGGLLDQHDQVHDRHLDLLDLLDVIAPHQTLELLAQRAQLALVVLSLLLGLDHVVFEVREGGQVGALVLPQEVHDLRDVLRAQLFLDLGQVVIPLVPELDLVDGPRVGVLFLDGALGVLFEDFLHEFLPHRDV